jgi:hypothetical protein
MEIKTNIKLYPWQRDVIDGIIAHPKKSIHIVKARRQCGKSIMIELILLFYAINKPNSVSICISPTLKQANKILSELQKSAENTVVYAGCNQVKMTIFFKNGSSIMFASAEQRDALRGYTVSGILCIDECAYIPDDIIYDLFPFVDANSAPMLFTSTPRFKQGAFYEYFTSGLMKEENIFSYDWSLYDTSNLLPPEKLELYRKTLPKMKFNTEYLGEFVDATGGVFGEFNHCLSNTFIDDQGYVMGVDWASTGSDETVITIFNKQKQMIYLDHFNGVDESVVIERIIEAVRRYKPTKIQVETNSIGQIYYNLLQKRVRQLGLNVSIKGFNTNNTSKQNIVNKMQVAIQNDEVQLLDNQDLVKQFTMFEAKLTPSGKVTYEAAKGYHDDIVMSTLLAFDCISVGSYSIL